MDAVNVKALVKNIKRERSYLAEHFSEHALTEIAKDKITNYPSFVNVCNAIDAAWTWFHTGFVNNFISKDPETNLLHLNW